MKSNKANFGVTVTRAILASISLAGFISEPSHAATSTWTDTGANNVWSTTTNWSPTGVPVATSTALFDTGGNTGTITIGTQSIGTVQFGQASETTPTALAYTLGTTSDTLNFSTSDFNVVNYYGAGNTATETVNSNLVLNYGNTASFGSNTYTINNTSGGNLVFNGAISTANNNLTSSITVTDSGAGNITFNGGISLNGNLNLLPSLGNTITLAGVNANAAPNAGTQTYINLGASATPNTGVYGNVVITNSQGLNDFRLDQYGSQGAVVLDSPTGITATGNGGYFIFMQGSHSSESAPNFEVAAGNNYLAGNNVLDIAAGQTLANTSYYVKVDAGATLVAGALYDAAPASTGTQTLYIYGAGNAVIYNADTTRNVTGNTNLLVKDGTGTWAFNGTNTGGNAYNGLTVEDGTFMANGVEAGGQGPVVVDPTNSQDAHAKPILGGTGSYNGSVTVNSGGTIAPGGTASNTVGAVMTSPIGSIGTLTVGGNLTGATGATFAFDINSSGAFTSGKGSSDLINVPSASLSLNGATLSVSDIGNAALSSGDYFDIIAYNGYDLSTFAGLPEGSQITVGANVYTIDYYANSGFDVALNWQSDVAYSSAYWTGGSGAAPASWATSANFLDGPGGSPLSAAPNSGTNVLFSANSSSNFSTTLDGSYTINSLTFGSGTNGSSAVTVAQGTGSGTLTINGGGIVVLSGAGNATISAPVALGANQMWSNSGANGLTVSGAVSGTGTLSLQNVSTGSISLTGGVTSTGNLILQNASTGSISLSGGSVNPTGQITNSGTGAGTTTISSVIGTNVTAVTQNSATSNLVLSGANTYTGPTTIVAGTLIAQNSQALGGAAAPLAFNGTGTLDLQAAPSNAYNTNVNGAATILSDSTGVSDTLGTLSIGNYNLTISKGTNAGTGVTFGQTTFTAAPTFTINTGETLTLGAVTNNAQTATITGAGNFAQTGGWTGTGGLTYSGTGTMTLNQANTFTGAVTLSGTGTVIAANSQALGLGTAAPQLTLSGNGGKLDLQAAPAVAYNTTVTNNYTIVIDNLANGAGQTYTLGTLSIGAKTLFITKGTNNTGGGGLAIGATTVTGAAGFNAASGLTISLGATSIGSGDTVVVSGTGGSVVQTGVWSGAGGVQLSGNGTLNLSLANTYTGATSISTGTLNLSNAGTSSSNSALGTGALTITGGTINNTSGGAITLATNNAINWNGNFTVGTASSTALNSINFGTGAVSVGAGRTVTFATGAVGDTLTFGGTTTNTLAGTTGITLVSTTAGNTLALGSFVLGSANTAAITDTFDGSGNVSIGGVISNGTAFANGIAYKSTATGTLTLGGANTYTGATSVAGGTVIATNANSLGGNASTNNVTVSGASTTLDYFAASDTPLLIGGTLAITGGTSTAIGGSIGASPTSSEISVTGKGSASSTVKVNIYGEGVTVAIGTNTYVLINGASGGTLNGATYSLGTVYNDTNFTVGALSSSTTQLLVSITQGTGISSAYWNGAYTGNTNVWAASNGSNLSNWATSVGGANQNYTPSSGTTVYISDTGHITTAPTATVLGANMSILGLNIQDTVNGLGLKADGNTLTIGTGGITMSASVPASTIAANVALGGNQTWANSSANALTVSGVVSGAGNLTLNGTGTIVLSNTNTRTGTTSLSAGTLVAGSAQALGTGSLTLGTGAILDSQGLASGNNTTVSGNATIQADTIASGGGVGVTTTLGTLSIGAQTLTVAGGSNVTSGTAGLTFGAVTATDAATFTVNNPSGGGTTQLTLASIAPTAAKTLTFNGSGNTTVTGVIGATTAPLTMSGTGTLTLGGTNTYTGITTLSSGTIVTQAAQALGTTASALHLNGGTLDLQAGSTSGYNTTVGGNVSIVSDELPAGAAASTYTLGTLSIGAQTLTLSAGSNITSGTGGVTFGTTTLTGASTLSMGYGSILRLGAMTNAGFTPTFTGAGSFSQSSNSVIWSGNGGVTFDSNFTGVGTLGTSNTYTGATTIQNGTVQLDGVAAANTAQALGKGTVVNLGLANTSSALLEYNSNTSATMGGFTINVLGNGGDTFKNIGSGTLTLSGGSIVKNGTTFTLTGKINIGEVISGSAANSDMDYNAATSTVSVAGTYNGPTRMFNGSTVTNGINDALPDTAGGASANTSLSLGDPSEVSAYTNTYALGGFNQTLGGLTSESGDTNSVINGTATLSTLTLNIASGTDTYAGLLGSGTAGASNNNNLALVKSGSGTLALTGANTYTGGTTISAGTVQSSNATGLGDVGGALAINGGGVLDLEAISQTVGAVTLGQVSTSTGSTIQSTGGSSTLTTSGVTVNGTGNTIASGATVSGAVSQSASSGLTVNGTAGADTLGTSATLAGTGTVGAVSLAGSNTLSSTGTLTTSGITVNGTGNSISSGTVGGNITFGTGTTALTVNGTASGTVAVTSGATLSGTGSTGAVTISDGGAVSLQNGSIGTLTVAGLTTGGSSTGSTIFFDIKTLSGSTTVDSIIDSGNLTLNSSTTINIGNLSGTTTLTNGTYTLVAVSGTLSGSLSSLTLAGTALADLTGSQTATLIQVGNSIDLRIGSAATSTSFTLATTASSTLLHAGGSTTLTSVLTNTGSGSADSIDYSGVGASASGLGSVTGGSTISGNLANGNTSVSNTSQTFTTTTGTSGTATISSTGSLTNHTIGGTPSGTPTGTSITVYSGFGTWNTNGSGSWGAVSATPANWTASGGTPGVTAGFTGVDTATFGAQSASAITVGLNGAAPDLNAITFSSPDTAYTLAQTYSGSGSSSITLSGTTPSINVSNPGSSATAGTQTISAPLILGATTSLNVAANQTLNISGQVSSSGTNGFSNSGPGTTLLSNASGNTYSGPTTITGGTFNISNTSGSATGSGTVTVGTGSSNSGVLGGKGIISGSSGVTIQGGGSLVSGSRSQISGTGLSTKGGMTLANTALTIGSGAGIANLTFDLGSGTSGINGGTASGRYDFSNPNDNTTYLSLTGSSSINFAGTTSISLVDLTNTTGSNGSLALRLASPYLLIHAGSNADYLNLVVNIGTAANPIYTLSQNDASANGFVLGVWAGAGNPLTDYTTIGITQYGADGVTPLTSQTGGIYYAPALYLDGGNLEVVPEPGTWALMLGGLALLVIIQRRKQS